MQKYPSGSRGSPAKGVASVMVARVQISSSAPKKRTPNEVSVFFVYRSVAGNRVYARVHATSENRFTSPYRFRSRARTLCAKRRISSSAPQCGVRFLAYRPVAGNRVYARRTLRYSVAPLLTRDERETPFIDFASFLFFI